MKKLSAFALCLLLAPTSVLALPIQLTPAEWHDALNIGTIVNRNNPYRYTHDITSDGFNPGIFSGDFVSQYSLTVGISDDVNRNGQPDRRRETVYFDQPGFFGNGDVRSFVAEDLTAGWTLLGLASLNLDGMLNLEIRAERGDFILETSKLWARGGTFGDPSQVPEPGSLALLGLGLVGLGLARRRLSSKG